MYHTTRETLGEVAHLMRACQVLMSSLEGIENTLSGTEQLTTIQEAEIADANQRCGWSAKDHVELATQFVEDWRRCIDAALAMPPGHLQYGVSR
jgi:hypothetical protein